MSRRSAPDSPWQNGVPPFALCQPSFNPMMNCNPMWGQSNLSFMAGNMMTPNMMRYGDNTSSRSNFRRNFDQNRDRRYDSRRRPTQQYHSDSGHRGGGGRYSRSSARDGKRPAPPRSRSPPPKRPAHDSAKKEAAPEEEEKAVEKEETEQDVEGQEVEEQAAGDGEDGDLYDPAEPTTDGAEVAMKGNGDDVEAMLEAEAALDEAAEAECDVKEGSVTAEGDVQAPSAEQELQPDESEPSEEPAGERPDVAESTVKTPEAKQEKSSAPADNQAKAPGKQQQAQKHAKQPQAEKAKDTKAVPKSAPEEKSTAKSPKRAAEPPRKMDERRSDYRRDSSSTPYQRRQKGKGWCTVCEINFEGSFLDHRRTEGHKERRDEKYPKCHPCSMGFSNTKQYELHCAGNFHKKNVEVQDNEVDENAGPLGEEYLEEMTAYYCTLCRLLLKAESRNQHCRTKGHYKRHRDVKRREEASKAKGAAEEEDMKEKVEDEDAIFTITDEVVSDDEGKMESADNAHATGENTTEKAQQPAKVEQQPEVAIEDVSKASATVGDGDTQYDPVVADCTADDTAGADTTNGAPCIEDVSKHETSSVQAEDAADQHELSGYKTAEEGTPAKSSEGGGAGKENSVTASQPKPAASQTAVRGRGRGQIGRGRAIRARRR